MPSIEQRIAHYEDRIRCLWHARHGSDDISKEIRASLNFSVRRIREYKGVKSA